MKKTLDTEHYSNKIENNKNVKRMDLYEKKWKILLDFIIVSRYTSPSKI